MWYLTHSSTDRIFYVAGDRPISVGRSGTDLIIGNDQSISRIHSRLIVKDDELRVTDNKSKYGTFLNGQISDSDKISEQGVIVADGDRILFGKFDSEWTVHHVNFATATSMLAPDKKQKLTAFLNAIQLKVQDDLDDTCTHLTMPNKTEVSHKLLQALASCIPVVTPNFWVTMQSRIKENAVLPKPVHFAPRLKEETLISTKSISLSVNENRKKLFANKTFVFFTTKQNAVYENIIRKAGGSCVAISKNPMTKGQLCGKNVIVVQVREQEPQSQNYSQTLTNVTATLSAKKRRMVPDIEIGLALLQCSIERYCNPEYNITSLFEPSPSGELKIAQSKVLVNETDSVNLSRASTSHNAVFKQPSAKSVDINNVTDASVTHDDAENEKENIFGKSKTSSKQVLEIHALSTTSESQRSVPETQMTITETQSTIKETQNSIAQSQINYDEITLNETSIQPSISISTSSRNKSSLDIEHQANAPNVQTSQSTSSKARSLRSNSTSTSNMECSNLFNFSESNSSYESMRKRKITEDENLQVSEVAKETQPNNNKSTQAAKKKKCNSIVDSDSDDEISPVQTTSKEAVHSSRKRNAEMATGGIFNFGDLVMKKRKTVKSANSDDASITCAPNSAQTTSSNDGPKGIIPLEKPREAQKHLLKKTSSDSIDSNDSGVWLSKKLRDVSLSDYASASIKTESISEIGESFINTEDIKPDKLPSLFQLKETSMESTKSEIVATRKQFVKKQNFKPQKFIITCQMIPSDQLNNKDTVL